MNPILHYSNNVLILKFFSRWLASVISLRHVPDNTPAVIWQHVNAPLPLLQYFDNSNVLVKTLSTFVTNFTEILWEEIQMRV
jgi:hypothetical protein